MALRLLDAAIRAPVPIAGVPIDMAPEDAARLVAAARMVTLSVALQGAAGRAEAAPPAWASPCGS
jgi:hypothetical protein